MTAVSQRDQLPAARPQGLTEDEVRQRRARGLGNRVPDHESRSYLRILAENTFTFIHVVLFAIALALVAIGHFGDALVTAGLVLANITVGVTQEVRAKRKLDRIALLVRPEATVIRDGRRRAIPQEEIVEGDLLAVAAGDQFLVDGIVTGPGMVSVDESLLTGESDLVTKRAGDPVYSGSFCMTGSALYEARGVGSESTAQRMTAGARRFRAVMTPVQRQVRLVIQVMIAVAIGLLLIVAATGERNDLELFAADGLRAAAVIFGLVPQGLIFLVTLTCTLAALRLAGTGALIQRLNAVESLSHVDVLCLDKTGTLTTNRLTLEATYPLGIGRDELRARLGAFAASVSAGNRTTAALGEALPAPRLDAREEAPFSSDRRWSGLSFDGGPAPGTYVLGAPEMLTPALVPSPGLTDLQRRAGDWARQGLRVLLFAHNPDAVSLHDGSDRPRLPDGLVPLGLVCLRDELRPEAGDTLRRFHQAGINLKIISGDHPATVAALARQAGFPAASRAVAGSELEEMNDVEFGDAAEHAGVFGRVTPAQKERLVAALRRRGHYVAVIGDGVNDVLALKGAQVGIALRSGSPVTRNVADLVLLDDSFAALPRAFVEGQRIRRGMQDVVTLFLARDLSISLVILAAALLGTAFPATPKLETVLALLTVGIPTFALAAWARPGATPANLLRAAAPLALPAGLTIATVSLAVYLAFLSVTGDVEASRAALYTAATLCGLAFILVLRPPLERVGDDWRLVDWRPAGLVAGMLALFALIVAIEPARRFFELEILSLPGYSVIALAVLLWATTFHLIQRSPLATRLKECPVR